MVDTNSLDRILDILGTEDKFEAQTKLRERFAVTDIQKAVTQWSQLIAWSWLEPEDYPADQQPSADQEQLRSAFIEAIQATALILIREHYQPGDLIEDMQRRSDELSKILNGTAPEGSSLTLPQLYQKLTGKNDYIFTQELTDQFLWVTSVERFTGICAGFYNDKIVQLLACPPRPVPSVLKGQVLRQWATQGDTQDPYTPPSPYIPTCNC